MNGQCSAKRAVWQVGTRSTLRPDENPDTPFASGFGKPRALLPRRRTPITGRRLQDSLCIVAVRRLYSRLPPEGAGGSTTRLGPANSRPWIRSPAGVDAVSGTDLHTNLRMSSSSCFTRTRPWVVICSRKNAEAKRRETLGASGAIAHQLRSINHWNLHLLPSSHVR